MKLAMGVFDSPQTQEQPTLYIDPHRTNIAVFGGSMTGKTTFLKTLLVRIHEEQRVPEEDVYIIDFGGNLGDYSMLPRVCACFDSSNEENIKRVFRTLERRLKDNVARLNSQSYYSMEETTPGLCPPHLMLIIDNVNAFLSDERYATYQDRLLGFCRDGLSKGLSVIFTANDLSGMSRIVANCGRKIAFEMPADYYFELYSSSVNKPMRVPGRGLINLDRETFEFQCFLPFADEKTELSNLLDKHRGYTNANRMVSFGETLRSDNVTDYLPAGCTVSDNPDSILIGLDYYEHEPICLNIHETTSIAIYGKRKFGKSNLLALILKEIKKRKADARFVYLDDGREQVKPFYDSDQASGIDSQLITDAQQLRPYLAENGYISIKKDNAGRSGFQPIPEIRTPYTVFVLQGKSLYRGLSESRNAIFRDLGSMIGNAEAKGYLFIFSDVQKISDAYEQVTFNNLISTAFLLDNIGEFVGDRGNKSVFGEMDARELKAEYAKCVVGDGYFYDTEADKLKKMRILDESEELKRLGLYHRI